MQPECTPLKPWHRRYRKPLIGLFVAGLLAIPQTTKALFGLGDIVHDPINWAQLTAIWSEDVSTGIKIEQTVETGFKIYQQSKDIYDLARFMSQHLTDKRFMETVAADAGQIYLHDQYGANVNVARVINGDYRYGAQAGADVWAKASSDPGDAGYLRNEQPGKSARLARYATIGLSDAAAVNCMQTVGQYRSNDPANRIAVLALKALHLDTGDQSNSQVAQQNITNGFAHQQLTEQQNGNAFHACEAQIQMANLKRETDNLKDHANFEADIAHQRATAPDTLDGEDVVAFMKGR